MLKRLFKTSVIAGLLAFAQIAPAIAQDFEIFSIDESFDSTPAGFVLTPLQSANATASIALGDVNGSNGLVFQGSWEVPASGSEDAYGFLDPAVTFDESSYQLDPRATDDIGAITFSIDAEVSDGNFDLDDGIFVILRIAQRNPNGTNTLYGYGTVILTNTSRTVDVVLSADDFDAFGNGVPDLSRNGAPISFGLQLGATYREVTGNAPISLSGTLGVDDWRVSVIGMPFFADDFEGTPSGN